MGKLNSVVVWLALLIIGLVNACCVSAVEVEDLYHVNVEVESQSSTDRWGAVLSGFKEILVRKSGSQQVLEAYEVQQAYRKVTSYLQRFEYSVNQDTQKTLPFILSLDFEPRLVDELIQEAGMPIWGSNRPISILWLAFEQDFQRQILKEDALNGEFAKQLAAHSKRRGIPVILPLMDLEDQVSVNISDIWGRFNRSIVSASERYLADSILTGRINHIGEEWQAKLSYINQGDERNIEFSEQSVELLIGTLTNRLAELLCEKYCVVETVESNHIALQVSNVGNFQTFKRLEKHLEGLSSIRKVSVEKLSATTVRFNVSLLGDIKSVVEGIQLGKKLVEEPKPTISPFKLKQEITQIIDPALAPVTNTIADVPTGLETINENHTQVNLDTSKVAEDVEFFYRWVE